MYSMYHIMLDECVIATFKVFKIKMYVFFAFLKSPGHLEYISQRKIQFFMLRCLNQQFSLCTFFIFANFFLRGVNT
jgi:hypothetical protein